jgi:hypothetical protein
MVLGVSLETGEREWWRDVSSKNCVTGYMWEKQGILNVFSRENGELC